MHSVLLALASPVWRARLEKLVDDGLELRAELPGRSVADFGQFMQFVNPAALPDAEIGEDNVEVLVRWFDEYGMESLRARCVQKLLALPMKGSRLRVAWSLGLTEVCEYYTTRLGSDIQEYSRVLMEAKDDPEMLVNLLPHFVKQVKRDVEKYEDLRKLARLLPGKLYSAIPGRVSDSHAKEILDDIIEDFWRSGF